MERPAAVPDGRLHKGWRYLRIVRGTDRSGVGRAGCRRGYPAGSARWWRWEASRRKLRGVDAGKRSTVMALRMEVARLRKEGRALEKALETREAGVQNLHKARIEADAELRKALRRSRRQKATI